MIAVDTNVIVRYLTGDDPAQAIASRKLVEGGEVFVSTSVLLETAWVLLNAYGFKVAQVVAALRSFAGLPGITVQDARAAAQALNWAEAGMDIADAIHLAQAANCDGFFSFDRRFATTVRRSGATPPVRVPV